MKYTIKEVKGKQASTCIGELSDLSMPDELPPAMARNSFRPMKRMFLIEKGSSPYHTKKDVNKGKKNTIEHGQNLRCCYCAWRSIFPVSMPFSFNNICFNDPYFNCFDVSKACTFNGHMFHLQFLYMREGSLLFVVCMHGARNRFPLPVDSPMPFQWSYSSI
jgi:hypothetical protein